MHTVMLRGHHFCDDLVGRKGMIEIDLAGILSHLNVDMIKWQIFPKNLGYPFLFIFYPNILALTASPSSESQYSVTEVQTYEGNFNYI